MAAGAKISENVDTVIQPLLKCCVCLCQLNAFDEPLITSCLHAICKKHAKLAIDSTDVTKLNKRQLMCTYCDDEIDATHLRPNILLLNYLSRSGPSLGVESNLPQKCCSCEGEEVIVTYCLKCPGCLCVGCSNFHQKFKLFKSSHPLSGANSNQAKAHQLLSVVDVGKNDPPTSEQLKIQQTDLISNIKTMVRSSEEMIEKENYMLKVNSEKQDNLIRNANEFKAEQMFLFKSILDSYIESKKEQLQKQMYQVNSRIQESLCSKQLRSTKLCHVKHITQLILDNECLQKYPVYTVDILTNTLTDLKKTIGPPDKSNTVATLVNTDLSTLFDRTEFAQVLFHSISPVAYASVSTNTDQQKECLYQISTSPGNELGSNLDSSRHIHKKKRFSGSKSPNHDESDSESEGRREKRMKKKKRRSSGQSSRENLLKKASKLKSTTSNDACRPVVRISKNLISPDTTQKNDCFKLKTGEVVNVQKSPQKSVNVYQVHRIERTPLAIETLKRKTSDEPKSLKISIKRPPANPKRSSDTFVDPGPPSSDKSSPAITPSKIRKNSVSTESQSSFEGLSPPPSSINSTSPEKHPVPSCSSSSSVLVNHRDNLEEDSGFAGSVRSARSGGESDSGVFKAIQNIKQEKGDVCSFCHEEDPPDWQGPLSSFPSPSVSWTGCEICCEWYHDYCVPELKYRLKKSFKFICDSCKKL